jgi:tryptophan-rich sensory protein
MVIYVMALIAAAAAGQFYRMRPLAGLLMVPYLGWLIFAAALNAMIESLNPDASRSLMGF